MFILFLCYCIGKLRSHTEPMLMSKCQSTRLSLGIGGHYQLVLCLPPQKKKIPQLMGASVYNKPKSNLNHNDTVNFSYKRLKEFLNYTTTTGQ